jgi:hypothetical protein
MAFDPLYNNTSIILHFNGSNGSTTFTDNSISPKTVTAFGNAQLSTAQSMFSSSASGLFDGAGDYLTLGNLGLINTDFTVECNIRLSNINKTQILCCTYNSGTTQVNSFAFYINSTNKILFYTVAGSAEGTTSLAANTWYHVVAVYRHSTGKVDLYLNGVLDGTLSSGAVVSAGTTVWVGGSPGDSNLGTNWLDGYMDELRITKATRYTSGFSALTEEHPNSAPPEVLNPDRRGIHFSQTYLNCFHNRIIATNR